MDIFGPQGAWGILLVIFLIFYIDAVFFPTLPEIFFIVGFMYLVLALSEPDPVTKFF